MSGPRLGIKGCPLGNADILGGSELLIAIVVVIESISVAAVVRIVVSAVDVTSVEVAAAVCIEGNSWVVVSLDCDWVGNTTPVDANG